MKPADWKQEDLLSWGILCPAWYPCNIAGEEANRQGAILFWIAPCLFVENVFPGFP